MNKLKFFLLCLIGCILHSASAMHKHQDYYDRFKVAYIQANKELLERIWKEFKPLTIGEREQRIITMVKKAYIYGDQGIYLLFKRICSYCVEPTSHTEYDTYCKCKSVMCVTCFKTLTQCPRCEEIM